MERLTSLSNQVAGNVDLFAHVPLAPPDAIFGVSNKHKADKDPKKINVSVGAYRDNEGKPYVYNAVKKAEEQILRNPAMYNHEYLPIDGYKPFVESAQKLAFGDDCPVIKEGRLCSAQVLSGTGGLRVFFDFMRLHYPSPVYVPNPTWGNHNQIIKDAGLPLRTYPYWNAKTRGLNYEGMISSLNAATEGSIILLHPVAHNPTGVDPSVEQWKGILATVMAKKHVVLFDCAYQGFATGDFEKDRSVLTMFLEAGVNFIVTQSFAKNFGLYGERAGCIHFVCANKDAATRALSQLKLVIRTMYSNPPCHGAFIVDRIARDPELLKEFLGELKAVSGRITDMRKALYDELMRLKVPGDWTHITSQVGMFSFTGLTPKQCEVLTEKWHVYLLKNGRISMAGINTGNVAHLAAGMNDVVRNVN